MMNYEENTTANIKREYVPIELVDEGFRDCCKIRAVPGVASSIRWTSLQTTISFIWS